MVKFFDTHAHYTDERLKGNYELIDSLFSSNVSGIVTVSIDIEDSKENHNLALKYRDMYSTVGIHPSECNRFLDVDFAISELRKLCSLEKVVAIGEIGLDYHYGIEDKDIQKKLFIAQLELAKELDLPVIIHDREAHGDIFDILLSYPSVKGIIHSYSGSAEQAKEYVKRGWYISFSGVITFKNASKVPEAALATPLDRILIETDSPYLAPVPMRGQTNNSGYVQYTAEKIASLFGLTIEEIARITEENAKRIFRIK